MRLCECVDTGNQSKMSNKKLNNKKIRCRAKHLSFKMALFRLSKFNLINLLAGNSFRAISTSPSLKIKESKLFY